jgi:dolichyl-phosphate beta-glucosyltransferase
VHSERSTAADAGTGAPVLSIVVPAFNEASGIADCIRRWASCLDARQLSWELLVVDDGSRDRTAAIVQGLASGDPRVRLIHGSHHGKGAAVRRGMLAARGAWRFLSDADLSMPPENIWRFFAALRDGRPPVQVAIGSREARGARRIGEPWRRHAIGRIFNLIVQAVALPGIQDTQCGFKLLSAEAVQALFPHARIDGFAFDVELLFLARRASFGVREVGIEWHARADSRVSLWRGSSAFADVLRVRWNGWRGVYGSLPPAGAQAPITPLDDVRC